MTPTDTRAKLETLFKRLSDPATSDLEAMEACIWFRKLRLGAEDVSAALGVPATGASCAPNSAPADAGLLAQAPSFGKYSLKKRPEGGWTWGRVLREDRAWLEYMEKWDKSQPWMVKIVREVLGRPLPAAAPVQQTAPDTAHAKVNASNPGNPDGDEDVPF